MIVGVVLVAAAAAALGWLHWRQAKWQKLREQCRARYAAASADYFGQWLQLPDGQHSLLPQQADAGAAKTSEEIRQQRHERFLADLDKLAGLERHLYPLACELYGDDWQEKLAQYNRRQKLDEVFFAGAVICCCVGGALVLSALGAMTVRRVIRKKSRGRPGQNTDSKNAPSAAIEAAVPQQNTDSKRPSLADILNCHKYSGEEAVCTAVNEEQGETNTEDQSGYGDDASPSAYSQRRTEPQDMPATQTCTKLGQLLGRKKQGTDSDESFFSSYRGLKQTRSDIKRGVKQFNKDAKLAKQISRRQPMLLDETLSVLTEEVATIRNYACQQEDRAKKLQNGYDWNIIRNFALRIIRCLDNLEQRMDTLAQQGLETEQLREIRDELTFALESSGLERYEPQLNSDYRGQEKTAEAVKDKQHTQQAQLTGKIAQVVRCGYRYVIDENNFKVVRAAQVKLFG